MKLTFDIEPENQSQMRDNIVALIAKYNLSLSTVQFQLKAVDSELHGIKINDSTLSLLEDKDISQVFTNGSIRRSIASV